MNRNEIQLQIIGKSAQIADILLKNKDVEIRKTETGIRVIVVDKKVVTK